LCGADDEPQRVLSRAAVVDVDREGIFRCAIDEGIVAVAAENKIAAGAAIERVVSVSSQYDVGARAALNRIVTVAAIDNVVSGATVDLVVAVRAGDDVAARGAGKNVVGVGTDDDRHDFPSEMWSSGLGLPLRQPSA
jgi:hypothetical protein